MANMPLIAKLKFSGGRNVSAVYIVATPKTPNFKWLIRQIFALYGIRSNFFRMPCSVAHIGNVVYSCGRKMCV